MNVFANALIGIVALALGVGALWGFFHGLELLVNSLGVGVFQYIIGVPLIVVIAYFLGEGIRANRKSYRRAR